MTPDHVVVIEAVGLEWTVGVDEAVPGKVTGRAGKSLYLASK
jgi:hypothetical protein